MRSSARSSPVSAAKLHPRGPGPLATMAGDLHTHASETTPRPPKCEECLEYLWVGRAKPCASLDAAAAPCEWLLRMRFCCARAVNMPCLCGKVRTWRTMLASATGEQSPDKPANDMSSQALQTIGMAHNGPTQLPSRQTRSYGMFGKADGMESATINCMLPFACGSCSEATNAVTARVRRPRNSVRPAADKTRPLDN